MRNETFNRRTNKVAVPDQLVERLALESIRTGRRVRDIVADVLEAAIPHNVITVVEPPHRRNVKEFR